MEPEHQFAKMNAPSTKRMTVPEFLSWADIQEGARHELIRGQIVAIAPQRSAHVRAKQRATNALDAAIRCAGVDCEAFVGGLGVMVDDETCYLPDALVNCGEPGAPDSMIAPRPVIVVDVLSLSTSSIDKTTKLADYFCVPSLAHYLIVDLERRRILHYRRQQKEEAIAVAFVKDGNLMLDPPGIAVAVADLFG